jgi:phosphoribosylaminoimidazolecarboxamide formyltransferase/IMP cyclohydrolase
MNRKNALLSVYNKDGVVEFAQSLVELGWTLYSSGGTRKVIEAASIPVQDVSTLVGGEAILGHRVVTLSREVHAGLLARPIDIDIEELEKLGIPWLGLVCVDMYPLKKEIAKPDCTPESVIEQTNIGGPTMLRSAAKGGRITACEASDRPLIIEWLKAGEPDKDNFITALRAKAEATVADYCIASATYHGNGKYFGFVGNRTLTCKYGENAYQTPAALYTCANDDPLALSNFNLVAGTEPSYNNVCDIERLLQTLTHVAATFDVNYQKVPLIALAVKHGNTCGAAIGKCAEEVVQNMVIGDPLAIFGGLVILNFPVTESVAENLLSYGMVKGLRRLLDGIIAPSFDNEAIEMLRRKGDKCRFIANPALSNLSRDSLDTAQRFRYVRGGFLAQPNYTFILDLNDPELVKYGNATITQENDMLLAKAICDTSNSNTITIVSGGKLIGNGVGQQARVYGSKLALTRADACGHPTIGGSAASDSFFPFVDGVEALVEAGIKSIISTSSSVNDKKVIEYCQEHGIVLYLIPDKIGRGFFGH